MRLQCIEIKDKKGIKRFITFPRALYKNDPNFIFEPLLIQRPFFSRSNPFFDHSQVRFFLAQKGGIMVGRVAVVTNTVHNETYHERTGFFGFFDAVYDHDVAKILLDKVVEIHTQNGFGKIIGPTNFTTNDSCGVLISGFEHPPVILMPYNKPYYNDLLLRYGFEKEVDMASWRFDDRVIGRPFFGRPIGGIEQKLAASGITIRNIKYKDLQQEIVQMREMYNRANIDNWGFVPLNQSEFRHMTGQLKAFVPERMVLLAEQDRKQVGFLVTLPDMNTAFRHIRSGKLLPFGWIKLLRHKRKITGVRILILGIDPLFRNRGVDIMLYEKLRRELIRMGFCSGEACYVMENNRAMNAILSKSGCTKVKEYRLYGIDLTRTRKQCTMKV